MAAAPPHSRPSAPKMSTETRLAMIVFLSLTTAISLTILGLTARHVSFLQNLAAAKRLFVTVVYQPNPWSSTNESARDVINYLPPLMAMQDTYCLLGAGVLSTIVGTAMLYMVVSQRDAGLSLAFTGKRARSVTIPYITTIRVLNGLIVAFLAAATGSAWYEYRRTHGNMFYTPSHSNMTHYNFESWNCALAPHIAPSMTRMSTPMLYGLCDQAAAARILVLPALVLSVVALGLQLWAWRKHNIAVRKHSEDAPPYDEVAWKHAELESQSERSGSGRSPVSPVSPIAAPEPVAEMPGRDTSRAELPMDSTIKEMMGETGHRELDAGNVAVEKCADEKRG